MFCFEWKEHFRRKTESEKLLKLCAMFEFDAVFLDQCCQNMFVFDLQIEEIGYCINSHIQKCVSDKLTRNTWNDGLVMYLS